MAVAATAPRAAPLEVGAAALADRTGLTITVCHFPPGTSKWNKIEHRLFSHIAMNWRGRPLVDLAAIVSLIASTHSRTGLPVRSELDRGRYPPGRRSPTRRWPPSASSGIASTATGTTPFTRFTPRPVDQLFPDRPLAFNTPLKAYGSTSRDLPSAIAAAIEPGCCSEALCVGAWPYQMHAAPSAAPSRVWSAAYCPLLTFDASCARRGESASSLASQPGA